MSNNYLQELLDYFKNKEKVTEKEVEKVFETDLDELERDIKEHEMKIIEKTSAEKTSVEKVFEKEVNDMLTPQKRTYCIIG
jgi:hypothetical protein